jgi:hypothetical protein
LEQAILRTALEKAIFRKVMRVKGVRHKSQWIKYWLKEATEQTDGKHHRKNGNNHRNDSKMCKIKPVLCEAWAELSPPHRKERSRRNE